MNNLTLPKLFFTGGRLVGEGIESLVRPVSSLKGIFEDEAAFFKLPQDEIAYEVSSHLPLPEGTPGGLYFGITYIHPWMVGDEYMMTKGHFHAQIDRAEYYWGLEGEGLLLLMDQQRNCWAEQVFPGSLHFISGGVAHRMINTCNQIFSFGACWPSDAGHDYGSIAKQGFSVRVKKVNGKPQLIKSASL
jgi:glucose-6-phosphate isomerase